MPNPLLLLLLVAAPPWPPPDMPTEAEFKQIQKIAAGARLQPSAKPPASVIDDSLPQPVTEAGMEAAIARFRNAWFLGSEFFGKQIVEVDAFLLPNAAWTKVTYAWTSPSGVEPQTLDLRSGRAEIPLNGKELLTAATAKVTIEAPSGFDEVTLPCGNAGKPEKQGALTFTIDSCDRDVFNVRIEGFEDDDQVVPLDAQKRPLAMNETARAPLFSGRDFDQVSYAEFKQGPGNTMRVRGRGKGTVAYLRWLRAKPGRKFELEVTALPEPKAEGFDPSARVRFASPKKATPELVRVAPKALALKLLSGRSCAAVGYNSPNVQLVFPQAGNSLLAKVKMVAPKVSGGAKGGFELETNGLDEDRLRYEWTLRAKGNDKSGAVFSFATLEAKATVEYPLKGETRRFENSSDAVTIAGHKVTVKLREGEELADGSGLQGVVAHDAEGRELRRFGYSESSGDEHTVLFMGPVATVKVNVVSQWVEKTVTAKLKPAPLRPKDKAGRCD